MTLSKSKARPSRSGEKNFFQNSNCLWSEYPEDSPTQEARYGRAVIRCCGHEDCARWATEFAVKADVISGSPIAQA